MDGYRTDVLTELSVCYILDGILVLYCILVTALLFREKFSYKPPSEEPEEKSNIYEELERPQDADPYQLLQPTKRKKKIAKAKKSEAAEADGAGSYDSRIPSTSAPSPH